jgi:hypothetical protein
MRVMRSLVFLFLMAVAAMPAGAQGAPVTATVTVHVPLVYRLIVDSPVGTETGTPLVRVISNQRSSGGAAGRVILPEELQDLAASFHSKGGGVDEAGDLLVRYTITSP